MLVCVELVLKGMLLASVMILLRRLHVLLGTGRSAISKDVVKAQMWSQRLPVERRRTGIYLRQAKK